MQSLFQILFWVFFLISFYLFIYLLVLHGNKCIRGKNVVWLYLIVLFIKVMLSILFKRYENKTIRHIGTIFILHSFFLLKKWLNFTFDMVFCLFIRQSAKFVNFVFIPHNCILIIFCCSCFACMNFKIIMMNVYVVTNLITN